MPSLFSSDAETPFASYSKAASLCSTSVSFQIFLFSDGFSLESALSVSKVLFPAFSTSLSRSSPSPLPLPVSFELTPIF